MHYKMIPYAVGVLLMVAAAVRFASNDDFVGAGIAVVAALVASFTAVKTALRWSCAVTPLRTLLMGRTRSQPGRARPVS